ncbi:MAG: hypothetical protein V1855_00395, partial [bacterium]
TNYNNGNVDEKIVRMVVLIGVADVKGMKKIDFPAPTAASKSDNVVYIKEQPDVKGSKNKKAFYLEFNYSEPKKHPKKWKGVLQKNFLIKDFQLRQHYMKEEAGVSKDFYFDFLKDAALAKDYKLLEQILKTDKFLSTWVNNEEMTNLFTLVLQNFSQARTDEQLKNILETLKVLVKYGADVNQPFGIQEKDESVSFTGFTQFLNDSTNLSLEEYQSALLFIKFFIEHGADLNRKDWSGNYPLYYVKHPEIAEFLIEKGAQVDAKNSDGMTRVKSAIKSEEWDLAHLLMSKGAYVLGQEKKTINNEFYEKIVIKKIEDAIAEKNRSLFKKLLLDNSQWRYQDGSSVADKGLNHALEKIKDTGFALIKIALDQGADPNRVMVKVLQLEDELAAMVVRLFLNYKLDVSKIVNQVIDKGKAETLQTLIDSGVTLESFLTDDANKIRAKKLLSTIKKKIEGPVFLHPQLMREFKTLVETVEKGALVGQTSSLHSRVLEKLKKTKKLSDTKGEKKFTQIEAFLRVWFNKKEKDVDYDALLRKLLVEEYAQDSPSIAIAHNKEGILKDDIDDYLNLFKKMNKKEQELKDDYVFYHSFSDHLGVVFDLETAILDWFYFKGGLKNFHIRFETPVNQANACDFIDYWEKEFKKNPVTDDSVLGHPQLKGISNVWDTNRWPLPIQTLSVNFVPFAFTGDFGEGTLYYFISGARVAGDLTKKILDPIFDTYGFDKKYIDTLKRLFYRYMSPKKGGHLLQICIPKNKADDFAFFTLAYGTPFRQKISGLGYDDAKKRHVNISEFLEKYMTDPFSLTRAEGGEDAKTLLNRIQGRLVFTPGFYDPENGVKIFSYDFVEDKEKRLYKSKFNQIVGEMMMSWISSGDYKKVFEKLKAEKEWLELENSKIKKGKRKESLEYKKRSREYVKLKEFAEYLKETLVPLLEKIRGGEAPKDDGFEVG